MSEGIKLFLFGIANSLRVDGYHNVVQEPKKLWDLSSKINREREREYKKVVKTTNKKITAYRY